VFNSEQRPELCKQIDAIAPDHKWTWEEKRERANCVGMVVDGKRLWPTGENILAAIADVKVNTAAREQWMKEHGKVVYLDHDIDANGNWIDKAKEAKVIESWQKLHASGRCAQAASNVVKNFDRLTAFCVNKSRTRECQQFHSDEFVVGECSVSPAESFHGYKQRANMKNPMPYAITMAQEKPQPDSAKLAH